MAEPEFEVPEFQIARLELEPGDYLVIKTGRELSPTFPNRHFLQTLADRGIQVIVMPKDDELSVVRKSPEPYVQVSIPPDHIAVG